MKKPDTGWEQKIDIPRTPGLDHRHTAEVIVRTYHTDSSTSLEMRLVLDGVLEAGAVRLFFPKLRFPK